MFHLGLWPLGLGDWEGVVLALFTSSLWLTLVSIYRLMFCRTEADKSLLDLWIPRFGSILALYLLFNESRVLVLSTDLFSIRQALLAGSWLIIFGFALVWLIHAESRRHR